MSIKFLFEKILNNYKNTASNFGKSDPNYVTLCYDFPKELRNLPFLLSRQDILIVGSCGKGQKNRLSVGFYF